MKLPFAIVKLRWAMVRHELRALGIIYAAVVILLSGTGLYLFAIGQHTFNGRLTGVGVISLLLFSLHRARSDYGFVSILTPRPWNIYLLEYTLLMLPAVCIALVTSSDQFITIMLCLLPAIAFMKPAGEKKESDFFLTRWITPRNFEWRSGFRKAGWSIPVLWMGSVVLAPVPFAPLVLIWFLLLVISGFYEHGESRAMVEAIESGPGRFLYLKCFNQLRAWFFLSVPPMVASGVFHPERWWVLLFFLCFSSLMIPVFIVSKYAVWSPGDVNRSNSLVNGICLAGLFLPFLLPLPVAVLVRNYRRAIHNLDPLLHDYN